MRPTVQELLESLRNATRELELAEQVVKDAKAAVTGAEHTLDLAKRQRLNAEQALRDAIRLHVGGPGEIL